jgi:anhydro-N-acetylmuramic acid kinase
MAAGGQGAPLVPFVDFLLYGHSRIGRAALNVGGIANVTIIPAGGNGERVFAFDTGPGNMVIDALVRHFSGGKKSYDRNAEMASRGNVLPGLLGQLLGEKYFFRRPPKSTGREQYGEAYVRNILTHRDAQSAKPEDVIRTVTVVTALSIVEAFRRFVFPRAEVKELIVSGGGARNPLLMASLEAAFKNKLRLRDSAEFGVPGNAKEAFAFAVLACESLRRRPGNVPAATGAKKPVILGKVCYAC